MKLSSLRVPVGIALMVWPALSSCSREVQAAETGGAMEEHVPAVSEAGLGSGYPAAESGEVRPGSYLGMVLDRAPGARRETRAGKQGQDGEATPAPEAADEDKPEAAPVAVGEAAEGAATPQDADTEADTEGVQAEEASEDEGTRNGKDKQKDKPEPPPRPGVKVIHPLIDKHCIACHKQQGDEEGMLSRLSYMRKTPEGWEMSVKRMVRVHGLQLPKDDAKAIVHYLANDHGLAREEARAAMGEVERRVHGSEEAFDGDLRETCAECHTLGRVFSERRDKKEWQLLKATHLAFFPLAQFQAFQGRRRGPQPDWESMTESEREEAFANRNNSRGGDRADSVLAELAKTLPLMTPEWESWTVNRREIPLEGTWTVLGHEIGRGDLVGTLQITRVDVDTYDTRWEVSWAGAAPVVRQGTALFYAGHSWRGKSETHAPGEPPLLHEVLLLEEDWDHMVGRLYTGDYNELGADVKLYRRDERTRVFAVEDGSLFAPTTGTEIVVHGTGFPRDTTAADFHLGDGVAVTAVDRKDRHTVVLTVDVTQDARLGKREVTFRNQRGPEALLLVDAIDYVRIEPGEGLSRVGGKMRGKMHERFEAVAMNRGPDDKPYTDDDVRVRVVPATWSLEEFPVREDDDDVQYVGAIDPATGVFTPGLDGPNPERKWQANNIGDVYVRAETTVSTPVRPDKDKDGKQGPPTGMQDVAFPARGHLLVMVPIYVQWDRWAWDRREGGEADAPSLVPGDGDGEGGER